MSLALIPGIGSLGGTELIIALVIILLLFGAKRIPELARGLGSGIQEFKKGVSGEIEGEDEEEKKEEDGEEPVAGKDPGEPKSRLEEDATADADRAEQKRS
jgi:sec-independent protein translocase protein TatA